MSGITGSINSKSGRILSDIDYGIRRAEMWRQHTGASGTTSPLANWYKTGIGGSGQDVGRAGGLPQPHIAAVASLGMTESSGTWTFPETGMWYIQFTANFYTLGSQNSRYNHAEILGTHDNSSYQTLAASSGSTHDFSTSVHASAVASTIFDVNDTANAKLRVGTVFQNSSVGTWVSSNYNITCILFMRLGDT